MLVANNFVKSPCLSPAVGFLKIYGIEFTPFNCVSFAISVTRNVYISWHAFNNSSVLLQPSYFDFAVAMLLFTVAIPSASPIASFTSSWSTLFCSLFERNLTLDVVCVCFKLGVSHCQRRGTNFLPTIKDDNQGYQYICSNYSFPLLHANKESKARQA